MLPVILGFFWLLMIFSMLYMLIIFLFTFGWFRTPFFYQRAVTPLSGVSIVVAVRNESRRVVRLLEALVAQDYPKDKYEIVVVDDHSEDDTAGLLKAFKNQNPEIRIRFLKSDGAGKKAALRTGIRQAGYELIATTDGDCRMGKHWLSRLVSFYELKKPELISGPVVYRKGKGWLQHFFMLDFMGLVASGAGSLGIGLPLMANGANLMFLKETYLKLLPDQEGQGLASGDDVFLMQAIVKEHGARSVLFIKDPQAIVETEPPANFRQFFRQRVRWASKTTAYRSWWAVFVSLTVFLFNLLLLLGLLATVLKAWFILIFLLFVLLKMMVEFPLLRHFSGFTGRQHTLYYLFLFGWFYPVYVVAAALISFFSSYSWKGRNNLR